MPDPWATDPTDLLADTCAQLGLSWQLEQTACKTPHPCCGGRGYNTWFHQEQLAKMAAGEDVNVSVSSLCCWRERLDPYCPTWNKAREQVVGADLINLVTFLKAWPETNLDEMAVFIYKEGGRSTPLR
jgi:hypothetical protein